MLLDQILNETKVEAQLVSIFKEFWDSGLTIFRVLVISKYEEVLCEKRLCWVALDQNSIIDGGISFFEID